MLVWCSQLRYILTLDAIISFWWYFQGADQINATSRVKEAVGGVHVGKKSSVVGTEFLGLLDRKGDIGRFHLQFKRFS